MSARPNVQDVQACVQDRVQAQTLLAVGLCGMCRHFQAFAGARGGDGHASIDEKTNSRAYECLHILHILHNAYAARVSRPLDPAHTSAHPAQLARARFSVPLVPKEVEEEGCW